MVTFELQDVDALSLEGCFSSSITSSVLLTRSTVAPLISDVQAENQGHSMNGLAKRNIHKSSHFHNITKYMMVDR